MNIVDVEASANNLQRDVGLTAEYMVSFADIPLFEQHLGCKIVVLYRDRSKKGYSFFQTSELPHDRTIFIYLQKNHYYGVKNVKALLGSEYFCKFCYATYSRKMGHKCVYHCNVCLDAECYKRSEDKLTRCMDCQRLCRSRYCYDAHKRQMGSVEGSSLCSRAFYCRNCNKVFDIPLSGRMKHKCAEPRCKLCGETIDSSHDHQCFIQPLPVKEPCEKLIFYDFECHQETGKHVANFICCMDFKGDTWTAAGEVCVKHFFTRFRNKKFSGYTFVVHNAKGYDSYLLLNYLVKQGVTPTIIAQGSKVMCFTDDAFNQRFIDSLCFLPMRLAAMPRAMGFATEIKGHFPHRFNIPENQGYVGPYPAPEFYDVDYMLRKDRDEFYRWYETVKDGVFDFAKEIELYCVNDVKILRNACMIFRREILDNSNVDPFSCITIASVCLKIFRTRFLARNTVAIPPLDLCINRQKTFSTPAIQWLEFLMRSQNIHIQHALNGGEVWFGRYAVDGYYEAGDGSGNVFEFLGCFYHGCSKCFAPHVQHPLYKDMSYGEVRERTQDRIQYLKHTHKVQVTVLWEHEWLVMRKSDDVVKCFLKSFDIPERLNPRDALFGGRTNALHLHYVAQPGEKIEYYDFTSLYPFVNKTKTYPVGHPTIIFKDFEPLENYFGIFRIKVLPPRGLWMPVLPFRVGGKLLFPLCRECVIAGMSNCQHSDAERALTSTWSSIEVLKALELGYTVIRIFEVWHFPASSSELFSGYIKMFLKTKQESSGYPAWVKNGDDEREYIRLYSQREGIVLQPENITQNPAKRSVAKLALNSLWGKLCQRADRLNTTLVSEPEAFLQFMFSEMYNVSNFTFVTDDVAMIQWRYADQRCLDPGNSNVFIGLFTTAYARLELYNVMEKLQRRVLYTDTDYRFCLSRW
ncbi:uncharacterized protein LOC143485207 isoform X1 [Brachyhypopomus gauderio]|uniref:uncharacterized protein LOC143485207 isoform X1 n=1 Tax=Brachyhypopomus gauderio TaxID=698409 RepID=UPI0040412178